MANIYEAFAGNGLTEADFAGLDPEQIQSVMNQSNQQRQLGMSMIQQQFDNQMAERKQVFDEEQANRMYKLAVNQDARDQMRIISDTYFKQKDYEIATKKLAIDRAQANASIAASAEQVKNLRQQRELLGKQQETLNTFKGMHMQLPGITDDKGLPIKMSLADMHLSGILPEVVQQTIAAGAKGSGGVAAVRLSEMLEAATALGANENQLERIKLVGPGIIENLSPLAIYESLSKNDAIFRTSTEEQKAAVVQDTYDRLTMIVAGVYSNRQGGNSEADASSTTKPAGSSVFRQAVKRPDTSKPLSAEMQDLLNSEFMKNATDAYISRALR